MHQRSSDPTCLNGFYAKHPEFLLAPAALVALLAAWPHGMSTWGTGALQYVGFSVLLQFAVHGWMCCYEPVLREAKIQQEEAFDHAPAGIATRQTAVLLSNVLYALTPLRPPSSSWGHFVGSLIGFALLYDAYFFLCHRAFHKSMKLYRRFHQLHHAVRDPMTFTAYYVTYQSHLVTEQLVFATASYLFVPRDVLLFYMYSALFETFAQHAGIEIDHLRVPLLPWVRVGHVRQLLSPHALLLGAYTTAHHDWHHEKNCKNYALAFTYLDKLAGTHHSGRLAPAVTAAPAVASVALSTEPMAEPAAEPAQPGREAQEEERPCSTGTSAPALEPRLLTKPVPPLIHARQLSGGRGG